MALAAALSAASALYAADAAGREKAFTVEYLESANAAIAKTGIPAGVRITIPNVLESITKVLPKTADLLDELDTLYPEGAAALRSLENFTCTIEVSGENGVLVTIKARTAKKGDAENLEAMLRAGMDSAAAAGIDKPAAFTAAGDSIKVVLRMDADAARRIFAAIR